MKATIVFEFLPVVKTGTNAGLQQSKLWMGVGSGMDREEMRHRPVPALMWDAGNHRGGGSQRYVLYLP